MIPNRREITPVELEETIIKLKLRYQLRYLTICVSLCALTFFLCERWRVAELMRAGRMERVTSVEPVLACYYSPGGGAPRPRDIHPHLCTHINVAFATILNEQIQIDDQLQRGLSEIIKLKVVNPKLKILLSIGGAGAGDGFSDMVLNHLNRKLFIRSIKNILNTYKLDGIDLDWEFPVVHNSYNAIVKDGLKTRERQHFSQLLREIRAEYIREKHNYLLTVAVAAPQTIVDIAYDVDQLDLYVDFVNVMTYDFHSYTKYTPFTGLNSPLYARPLEQLYLSTLNINYTVNMYLNKGLGKDKIVVGIPTYGHTFTLVNSDNAAVGSPASGFGSLGSKGFVNYPDICCFVKNYNTTTIKEDDSAKVPFLYNHKEWVSYDTTNSVEEKVKYILDNGLRGAMIYSLNADDYAGVCEGVMDKSSHVKFPLVNAAKNLLKI